MARDFANMIKDPEIGGGGAFIHCYLGKAKAITCVLIAGVRKVTVREDVRNPGTKVMERDKPGNGFSSRENNVVPPIHFRC